MIELKIFKKSLLVYCRTGLYFSIAQDTFDIADPSCLLDACHSELSKYDLRVYSKARLCRISAFRKKMPHKIYVGASNGAHKIAPKGKYSAYF